MNQLVLTEEDKKAIVKYTMDPQFNLNQFVTARGADFHLTELNGGIQVTNKNSAKLPAFINKTEIELIETKIRDEELKKMLMIGQECSQEALAVAGAAQEKQIDANQTKSDILEGTVENNDRHPFSFSFLPLQLFQRKKRNQILGVNQDPRKHQVSLV